MKQPYTPPSLEIIIFAPVERLSADPFTWDFFDLRALTDLSRSAGDTTISEDGDIFVPIG